MRYIVPIYISFLYFPELHTHRLSEITYYYYLRRISRLRSLNQRYYLAHILMHVKTENDKNIHGILSSMEE